MNKKGNLEIERDRTKYVFNQERMTLKDIKGLVEYYADKLALLHIEKMNLTKLPEKTEEQQDKIKALEYYIKDLEQEGVLEILYSPRIY